MTLIEVLIGAIILFMTLALAAQVFQHQFLLQERAQRAALVMAAQPAAMAEVERALGDGQLQGQGRAAELDFSWQAELVESAPTIGSFDPELGSYSLNRGQFSLYRVTLDFDGGARRQLQYDEVIWSASHGE